MAMPPSWLSVRWAVRRALRHPLGGAARKPVGRRPRGQPHGLDLGQGKGTGQPGAGRFQKGFLGGKVGGGAGYPPGRQALGLFRQAKRLPFVRAEHPPRKGPAMGPGQALL